MQVVAALSLALACAGATAEPEHGEADFLDRVRRLTFEGRRAGEGYFSTDGTKMVLQSEREPGNPFYQIYELDLTDGEIRRVSPGVGKTTCAFYKPGTGSILFASTHHDPASAELQRKELEQRAAGEEKRYAWDYDPEMEIYVAAPGGSLTRLTDARGYDAEGSYSPDGRWIVFTSNRNAYGRELSEEERRRLDQDPSYFADIYVMRSDGTDVRRLTEAPGYDGGPFFMPDGERIVWRSFDVDGLIADIWTINRDGSDRRQITDFNSMSWAPYPHPSGEYLLFTSNKLGFENFELFIVDVAGSKEPVRVTYTQGFDGLPVPSPDGERLAWTSTRRTKQAQIFLARWNHRWALDALAKAPQRGTPPHEGD
jgi:Tol biopolymer transport system component